MDVTPYLIRSWLLTLSETQIAGGLYVKYRTLKAFLSWAWLEYDIRAPNPMRTVKPLKLTQEVQEPLVLPVLKAMPRTCTRTLIGERDRAMPMALLDTGCRASEFIALDLRDVDLKTCAVIVRHGKGGRTASHSWAPRPEGQSCDTSG